MPPPEAIGSPAAKKVSVVRVMKRLRPGAWFWVDNVDEQDLESYRVPYDAVPSLSYLVHKRVKHGMEPGEIVCKHDLMWTMPKKETVGCGARESVSQMDKPGTVLFAAKDIEHGTTITQDCLECREIDQLIIPQDALADSKLIVGRYARFDIPVGALISQHDLAAVKECVGLYRGCK